MAKQISQVMCFGEPLVGFFTKKEYQCLSSFQMAIGGDTSNVALAVTKLGHQTSYTTRMGNDFFAEKIKELWDEEGINTSYVFKDSDHKTGIYFSIYDSQGGHQFIYERQNSASSKYSVKDAEKVVLDDSKVFHLSGISQAISKSCLEASFFFMNECKKREIMISYDLNYRRPLWSKEYFNSIALYTIKNFANLVSLNLNEAEVLGLKGAPENLVNKIMEMGPEIVALKLGEKGCVIGSSEGVKYGKPFNIDIAVETTGAGDSLTAAVIVGILERMELATMVRFANAVASRVCTVVGSTSGQPTRAEIDSFLSINQHI